jgi:hypothetical protein
MEAAQAQAQMYANIGNTLASFIFKKGEMDLKGKEIEAQNKATEVAGRKVDAAEKANTIKENEKNDDAATKYLTARTAASKSLFDMHDLAIQGIDARISGLTLELKKTGEGAPTPARQSEINGLIEALNKKREYHQKNLDDITSSMKNLPTTLSEYRQLEEENRAKIEGKNQAKEAFRMLPGVTRDMMAPFTNAVSPLVNSAPAELFKSYFNK